MSANPMPAENPLRELFEEIVYGCYSQTSELNDGGQLWHSSPKKRN